MVWVGSGVQSLAGVHFDRIDCSCILGGPVFIQTAVERLAGQNAEAPPSGLKVGTWQVHRAQAFHQSKLRQRCCRTLNPNLTTLNHHLSAPLPYLFIARHKPASASQITDLGGGGYHLLLLRPDFIFSLTGRFGRRTIKP